VWICVAFGQCSKSKGGEIREIRERQGLYIAAAEVHRRPFPQLPPPTPLDFPANACAFQPLLPMRTRTKRIHVRLN
jgi:hypothetical protein